MGRQCEGKGEKRDGVCTPFRSFPPRIFETEIPYLCGLFWPHAPFFANQGSCVRLLSYGCILGVWRVYCLLHPKVENSDNTKGTPLGVLLSLS